MPVSKPPHLLLPSAPAPWSPFLFGSPLSGLQLRSLTTSLLSCTQAPDVWSWPLAWLQTSRVTPSMLPVFWATLPHTHLFSIWRILCSSHCSPAIFPNHLHPSGCPYVHIHLHIFGLAPWLSLISLFWPCLLVTLSTLLTGRGLSFQIVILVTTLVVVTVILFIKQLTLHASASWSLGVFCSLLTPRVVPQKEFNLLDKPWCLAWSQMN